VTRSFDNMAIAQARIAEEANRRTGTLDLSDLGLEELPEELFELRHLRVLDLGKSEPWNDFPPPNCIDAQRERLGCLTSLKVLLVAGSDLTTLSPLQTLQYLQRLDCWNTAVSDLTPLAGLTALQQLHCSECRLRCLPHSIVSKPSLSQLVLYASHVPGVPSTGILSQDHNENSDVCCQPSEQTDSPSALCGD
jgi:Leucine-rich repeat (LRR) protein